MVDARRPGSVIGLVVPVPEWLQAETRAHQALRNVKVIRDERLSHRARLRLGAARPFARPCRSGRVGKRELPTGRNMLERAPERD